MTERRKGEWKLILNDAQRVIEFSTRKELRVYARQHHYVLHQSPLSDRSFYTEAVGYVPGNY